PAGVGDHDVRDQFGDEYTGDMRGFNRVRMLVLAVAGAEFQPAQQLDNFGMQAMDAGFISRPFAFLADDLLDFGAGVFDQFLDARRVDAAIHHQLGHRAFGDFTAHGVETADRDGLRRVVHHDIDAGRQLKRADIAPVAPDDTALHFIARQRNNADRNLADVLGGEPLDGQRDHFPRPVVGFFVRFGFHLPDDAGHIVAGFLLNSRQQFRPRFFGGHLGDTLQFLHALFFEFL